MYMGAFFSKFIRTPAKTKPQQQIHPIKNKEDTIYTIENEKRALIIGINYNEDQIKEDDLQGCVNDMNNINEFLQNKCHFMEEDIHTLTNSEATRERIQDELTDLVVFSHKNPGSEIWLSYSGHGSNVTSYKEDDLKSEVICPSDYATSGMITDTWMQDNFVMGLEKTTKVFALMDCCNSGSNLNLPYRYKQGKTIDHDANKHSTYSIEDLDNMCDIVKISGCEDDQTSADYYERTDNEFQGALTNAFIYFQDDTDVDILDYYQNIILYLKVRGFSQTPVLSFSKTSMMKNKIIL
jgi:hypothetical protein